jgi:hypothetical protein
MESNSLSTQIDFISNLSRLCSEFPIGLIAEEAALMISDQFPELTVGFLIETNKHADPLISLKGESKHIQRLRNLLNDYCVLRTHPEAGNRFKPAAYDIGPGPRDFQKLHNQELNVYYRPLKNGENTFGIFAFAVSSRRKISDEEFSLLKICSDLVAGSAAIAYRNKLHYGSRIIRVSYSPRQVVNSLYGRLSECTPLACVMSGYMIPGEETAEVFISRQDQLNVYSEFNSDLSIPKEHCLDDALQLKWFGSVNQYPFPEALVTELQASETEYMLNFPLSGRKDFYGFCIVGLKTQPDENTKISISEIVDEFTSDFLQSAALYILIISYRQMAGFGDRELVRLTTATVNHHINNPLAIILGAAQMLLLYKDDLPEDIRKKVEMIEINALRIKDVISTLRSLKNINIAEYLAGEKFLELG